jgi:hypothetical protein
MALMGRVRSIFMTYELPLALDWDEICAVMDRIAEMAEPEKNDLEIHAHHQKLLAPMIRATPKRQRGGQLITVPTDHNVNSSPDNSVYIPEYKWRNRYGGGDDIVTPAWKDPAKRLKRSFFCVSFFFFYTEEDSNSLLASEANNHIRGSPKA